MAEQALVIESAIQGEVEVVPTPWGPVSVTVAGDRSLTPLLTYHDVGVNHQGCFQQLMTASSHLSLLVRNFCFYHVDAPGCEAGGEFTPKDKKALDAENLAEQVSEVIRHLKLRDVVGFGVGMGGYVLASFAARYPKDMVGLILASPLCTRPGWWEWGFGKKAAYHLWMEGWTPSAMKHLTHRLYSRRSYGANDGNGSDLVQYYRMETAPHINPLAVSLYLTSALKRKDISDLVPKIRCKTMVLSGYDSAFEKDSLQLNSLLKQGVGSWVEIDEAGALVTEERPQLLLQSIQLFLQGLQQLGHGQLWDLSNKGNFS
eukprot:CAMPEP_0177783706 /NCGR_PEP_ID=MMETSP0491_2-20121128/19269_1 /TAXON_ID=63592 /ORGANISM="Tetraselmis chuii, Strain PLY429" /LENGTH=315 /DNA_ID=CAMNT_0019304341 /DNA_START=116 /DNA_END=1063 /DNA_ORIENTATION=-